MPRAALHRRSTSSASSISLSKGAVVARRPLASSQSPNETAADELHPIAVLEPPIVLCSHDLAPLKASAEVTELRFDETMASPPPVYAALDPALELSGTAEAKPTDRRASGGRRALTIVLVIVSIGLTTAVCLLATIVALYDVRSVDLLPDTLPLSADAEERIPRIIHQTWKTDALPDRWRNVSDECRRLHPSFEYKLWTDEDGRNLIRDEFPSFLTTYDDYPYSIQRADAMRYFILLKHGGIYLDLDVGCRRPLDPLLSYSAVMPYTKPVGLSNDVMMAAKGHPYMRYITDHLSELDGYYGTHYATVMFSTGPMAVSRLYNRYVSGLADGASEDERVRVLPRPLYGKAQYTLDESFDPFFRHYFASSWHGDDAGFIAVLAVAWRWLIVGTACIVTCGFGRLLYLRVRRPGGLSHQYSSLPTTTPPTSALSTALSLASAPLSPQPPFDPASSSPYVVVRMSSDALPASIRPQSRTVRVEVLDVAEKSQKQS